MQICSRGIEQKLMEGSASNPTPSSNPCICRSVLSRHWSLRASRRLRMGDGGGFSRLALAECGLCGEGKREIISK